MTKMTFIDCCIHDHQQNNCNQLQTMWILSFILEEYRHVGPEFPEGELLKGELWSVMFDFGPLQSLAQVRVIH